MFLFLDKLLFILILFILTAIGTPAQFLGVIFTNIFKIKFLAIFFNEIAFYCQKFSSIFYCALCDKYKGDL
jgi:hypothetical protein